MKNLVFGLLISVFFLVACGGTPPLTQPTPASSIDNPTSTPSPLATATRTLLPSATPTASITPLPTIPTFTPTFDVSTIVTVTPAPKAECPKTIPYPENDFDLFEFWENGNYKSPEEAVLALLNNYGPEVLVNYERNYGTDQETMAFQDFTNDGVPELALRLTLYVSSVSFAIFGCRDGVYQQLLDISSIRLGYAPIIFSIEDNNKNGIPELTILEGYASQGGHSFGVYEWDGQKFGGIHLWVEATGEIHYEDIDHDFLKELILDSGIPVWETYWSGLPWRNERTYYKWNGQNYSPDKIEFDQPEFRFQAVQDADLALSQQEYDKALSLYQDVIFSDKLKGYSPEVRENLQAIWHSQHGEDPTPTPYPIANDEYSKLAAYAYFRIMLLHLVQGYESDATVVYTTLREKFGNDPYGRPYAEMASAFWDAYQSTRRMYDGCAAAIQYAVEHPEILTPLGSDYHGAQSHTYVPADVCPFR